MMMISKPFFSLIIPCYNSSKTISRLLDSLLRQGLEKDDLQVILIDDNSTDNWQVILNAYSGLNYEVHDAKQTIHCPSNTRRAGMPYIKGEWTLFADHDDFLEDNALITVKEYILANNIENCLVTILRSWNEATNEYTLLQHKQAWTHGKFYRSKWLKDNNINFKQDLITHEDIYFNACVLAWCYEHLKPWDFFDFVTYRWVENEESITRAYKGERGYLHENFNDYIVCASEPYWSGAVRGNYMCINSVLMALVHAYFYYEACSYFIGADKIKDHIKYITALINKIKSNLKVSNADIINYVYEDPERYKRIREDCVLCEGDFIEKTSFRDFVLRLGGEAEKTAIGK